MAKGKEAAQAANRRYEAAVEHIDRLTDELVQAKARARSVEAVARRTVALEGEVARLQHHIDERTSDLVARLRSDQENARAEHARVLDELAAIIVPLVEHDEITLASLGRLEVLLPVATSLNRDDRRRLGQTDRRLADVLTTKELREMGLAKIGPDAYRTTDGLLLTARDVEEGMLLP